MKKNLILLIICSLLLTSMYPITANAWDGSSHYDCVTSYSGYNNLSYAEKGVLNYACRVNDNSMFYMGVGPKGQFHGGLWNTWATGNSTAKDDCNYLACYIYLTKVANAFGGDGTLLAAKNYLAAIDSNAANVMYGNGIGYAINSTGILNASGTNWITWADIFASMNTWLSNNWSGYTTYIAPTKALERTFVFGMAIHVATDAFAHSAWSCNDGINWYRLGSSNNSGADTTTVRSQRYAAAQVVAHNVLDNYFAGTCGDIYDFALTTSIYYNFNKSDVTYDARAFRLGNFLKYATAIDSSASSNTQFQVPDAKRTCTLFNWTLNFENHLATYPN